MGNQSSPAALAALPLRPTTAPRIIRCPAGWRWRPGQLSDFELLAFLGGEGELRVGGEKYAVNAHRAVLLAPGCSPTAEHDSANPLVKWYCHFESDTPRMTIATPAVAIFDIGDAEGFGHLLRFLASTYSDETSLAEAGLALGCRQVLTCLARRHGAVRGGMLDSRIARVVAAVSERPGEAWDVDRMAAAAHLSRSQLNRLFRASQGVSPREFVIRKRVEQARLLLVETDMSLQMVADALGYTDVYFFTRQFSRLAGMPPGRYRRQSHALLCSHADAEGRR